MITPGAPFRIVGGRAFLVLNDEHGPDVLLKPPHDEALVEALITLRSCMFPDLWPSAKVVDFPAPADPSTLSLAEAIGRGLARADFAAMEWEE